MKLKIKNYQKQVKNNTNRFISESKYLPKGDQPKAISELLEGLKDKKRNQVLLGVTGSGKTFTMANVIAKSQRPTLIMAHNKTLAAQLYNEMKQIFPQNAVEYFVSYYDYYQPEAYIVRTDTYIEKDASINEQIDLLRHSATRSLLERRDVIVISSISCIYGIGSPELYNKMTLTLSVGDNYSQRYVINQLVKLQYERNDVAFKRNDFRVRGDIIDIFPSHYDQLAWKLSFFGDELESITEFDVLTGKKIRKLEAITIYASSHYVTPQDIVNDSIKSIKKELKDVLGSLRNEKKLLEMQRLEQRTKYDIEMLRTTGSCKGIENYTRYLTGRKPGMPPPTLFEYLPEDAILFVDESHVTVPQIYGMYNGDRARKTVLVEHGFRLPSALDNRPLTFDEWDKSRPQTIFVSATPGFFELDLVNKEIVEQIVRPTGLLDPLCIIKPASKQVEDFVAEAQRTISKGFKVLVTTLTKKMAEDVTEYLTELGYKSCYIHSEIKTLERVEIIRDLRLGKFDILVGINLLREGIDIPECALVAIFDADKEGFLRSETSLIQTIGRAARNVEGKVLIYADVITKSIKNALNKTERRRMLQKSYNKKHNINPSTVKKPIEEQIVQEKNNSKEDAIQSSSETIEDMLARMKKFADNLDFEKALVLREKIKKLTDKNL